MPSRLMDPEIKPEPPDFDEPELPVTPPPEYFAAYNNRGNNLSSANVIHPSDVKKEPMGTPVNSENSNVSLLLGQPVTRERIETERRGTERYNESDSSELSCTPPPSRSLSDNDISYYNIGATTAIIPAFKIKKEPVESSPFQKPLVEKTVISAANSNSMLLPADPALCRAPESQGREETNPCFEVRVPLSQTPQPFINDTSFKIKKEPDESSSFEVVSAANSNNELSNCPAAAVVLIPEHKIKKEKIKTASVSMPTVGEVAKSVVSATSSNPVLLPADRALATERWVRNNPYNSTNKSFNSVDIDTENIAGCNVRKRSKEIKELDVPRRKRKVNKSVTGVENSNTEPFQSTKSGSVHSNPPVRNVTFYGHTREPDGSVLDRPEQHMSSSELLNLKLNSRNNLSRETVHGNVSDCAANCEILPDAQGSATTEKHCRISSPSGTMLTHKIKQCSLSYNAAERHSHEINVGLPRTQHVEGTSEKSGEAQVLRETVNTILTYASSSRKNVFFQPLKTAVKDAIVPRLPIVSEEVASAAQKSKMYFSSFCNEDHKSVYCDPPVIYVSLKNNKTPAIESEVKPKGIFNMIKILEDTISQCPDESYNSLDPSCDAKTSNVTFLINDKSYKRALFSLCTSELQRNSASPVPNAESSIPLISLLEKPVTEESGGNQGRFCHFEDATRSSASGFSCEGANYSLQNSSLLTLETPENKTSPVSASVSSRPAVHATTFETSKESENLMPVETPKNSVHVKTSKASNFLNEIATLNLRNSSSGSISENQGQSVSSVFISENNSSSLPVTVTTGTFSAAKRFNTTTSNFTAKTANSKSKSVLQNLTNEFLMTILDTARSATPRSNMTCAHPLFPDRAPNAGNASQERIFNEFSNFTGQQECNLTETSPIDLSTKKN